MRTMPMPLSPAIITVLISSWHDRHLMDTHGRDTITFWCSRENRFEKFGKGIPLALAPCTKEACEEYRDGYPFCIHMVRVRKEGRI